MLDPEAESLALSGRSAGRGDKERGKRVDDPRPGREKQALGGQWPWGRVAHGVGEGPGAGDSGGAESRASEMGDTLGSLTCVIRIRRNE